MKNANLVLIIEECAEVIQAITKIQRFGIDSTWNGISNYEQLVSEIGDLLAVIDLLNLPQDMIDVAKTKKIDKLKIWSNGEH